MIGRYLHSLSTELRVPSRTRARIVAEVRDHLREAVEAGCSESEAVRAFGDPGELAARFHEQLAGASAERAGARTALLMSAFVVGCAAAALGPAGNDFPYGVVTFLGAQLAVVAAALGLARWLRYRDAVPASRLADVYRANGLAVACVGVVSLAELLDALSGGLQPALAIGSAAMLVASVGVGISVARSRARARVVPAGAQEEDAVDDLLALAGRVPAAAPLVRGAGSAFRRHPWRFCLLFASACGIALAAQHAVVEGAGPAAWRSLLAGLVIASIEAVAVGACFAAFGRLLGIRRSR